MLITLVACSGQDQAITEIEHFIKQQNIDKSQPSWKTQLAKPEPVNFNTNKRYIWQLETSTVNYPCCYFQMLHLCMSPVQYI